LCVQFAAMSGGRGWRALRAAAAAAVAAFFLLPLAFMLSGSLRKPGLPPPRTPELLPDPVVFGNYARAFELVDLGRATLNSLLVASVAAVLSVLVASWAGFALARLPRRLADALVAASLAALMVPLTALLVPRFALFRSLDLIDTYVPLVAVALLGTSPFYVLVYAWAFGRLPPELYEACRLEGMTPFAIWRRMAMPLVRPVTVGIGVLAFLVSWGNFLDPLIYIYDRDLFTLPLALKSLAQLDRTNYPLLLAGAVVATAPVIAVFLVAQRWFLHEHRGPGWLGR
jgi:multiple sugar transport system permease protein